MTLKHREKIMIGFALIAIGIWIFDSLYYTPQSRKLPRLRGEVKEADLKLSEYQLCVKGSGNIGGRCPPARGRVGKIE